MLEISYILHRKKEYYAIKEDAKNKPKSESNNSDNFDCCIKNPSTWKREKKKKKTRKIFEKQIANKELKKDLQTPKSLSKNYLQKQTKKSPVHKTFNT